MTITITTNEGKKIFTQVSRCEDGESVKILMNEGDKERLYSKAALKEWLQVNKIEMQSWEGHAFCDFGELYFLIYEASYGGSGQPPINSYFKSL